ncbi:hypothetical protein Lser_V15G02781 [Lactuca serriola]
MLIFSTCIFVLYHFACSGFQSGMPSCEIPAPQTNERRDTSKIHTRMLPSYPSKDQNVSRSKCGPAILRVRKKVHWRFFLHRNTSMPTSIKENISNHIMSILETMELSTMNRVFPKGIQTCLATNWAYLVYVSSTHHLQRQYSAALLWWSTQLSSSEETLFGKFLDKKGFRQIPTPKIISGTSEGGAAVFKLDYYKQPACLAQSPKLHKQMAICGDLGRVFIVGPVFRAKDSNTNRHLCEFTGLDFEMEINEHYSEVMDIMDYVFVNMFNKLNDSNTNRHLCEFTGLDFEMEINEHYSEVMDIMDYVFVNMFNKLNERCQEDLEAIKKQYPFTPLKITFASHSSNGCCLRHNLDNMKEIIYQVHHHFCPGAKTFPQTLETIVSLKN